MLIGYWGILFGNYPHQFEDFQCEALSTVCLELCLSWHEVMSKERSLKRKHHKQADFCYTRPSYREARWERAVKVYTINQESKYLLVQGIPSVGVSKEMVELSALYGEIEEYRILDEYPSEEFTETYWIKFKKIQSARFAKKKLDMRSFYGGILHVSYAPEFENIDDTRSKLKERERQIYTKCKELYSKETENKRQQNNVIHGNEEKQIELNRESNSNKEDKEINCSSTHSPSLECQEEIRNQNTLPQLPLPPTNLPYYLYSIPPPPPPEYPKIPTKHATLPADLQTISRIEMEGQAFGNEQDCVASKERSLIIDKVHVEQHENLNNSRQSKISGDIAFGCSTDEKSERLKSDSSNVKKQTVKQIVWKQKPSVTNPPSSPQHQSAPGAWDPFAESRKQSKSLTGDQNLDQVALNIRNQLKKLKKIREAMRKSKNGKRREQMHC